MIEKILQYQFVMLQAVETMRDGLMVVDNEGNILFFNKAAPASSLMQTLKKSLLKQRLFCAKK
jgi:hypothetical protein